jgi:serine/threonine protein kinase
MGEVYRARHRKLGREVAIKILPGDLTSDPDRRHRFEREARAASALSHPNIVTIHDIDEDGGAHYIAMELVEGQTVRSLLAEGDGPSRVQEGDDAADAGRDHRGRARTALAIRIEGFPRRS